MSKLKRYAWLLLSGCLLLFLAGCGGSPSSGTGGQGAEGSGALVGVSMPNRVSKRWIQDGANIEQKLLALGYRVNLQYAEDMPDTQAKQIEKMIDDGASCLIISPINSDALKDVLAKAKEKQIPVIAYDRMLMGTDAVSYYVTFDSHKSGEIIGQYIAQKLGLPAGKGPYRIEFFAGSPDDNNAHAINDGVFSVLKPYLDKKQLIVPSGQTEFGQIAVFRWLRNTAEERMNYLLDNHYTGGTTVDVVVSPSDVLSHGIVDALQAHGYRVGKDWPLVTGQDGELDAARNILLGKQEMTMFKDTRILADKCVFIAQAAIAGEKPEMQPDGEYDNGLIAVPTYFCMPVPVNKGNLAKELVDSGYYKKAELED